METIPQDKVIVGIVDSLAGLRAVRVAVAQARSRGAELIAIRAYPEPRSSSTPFHDLTAATQLYGLSLSVPGGQAREEMDRRRRIAEQKAISEIRQTFGAALGGMPHDIPVQLLATTDRLDTALTSAVYGDGDLIVLAINRRPPRGFSRRAARRGCPVLLVPPHEFAHDIGRRRRIDPEAIIAAQENANGE